jgi:hypothetical protein
MLLRDIIAAQFWEVAHQQRCELAPLSDDLELLRSGLDSLSIALIVARLEEALGFNPFESDEVTGFPTTFGDFVNFYGSRRH